MRFEAKMMNVVGTIWKTAMTRKTKYATARDEAAIIVCFRWVNIGDGKRRKINGNTIAV